MSSDLGLLEAASCKLPIISTNVPGCREICINNFNGLLVEPRDAISLAKSIERLAFNKRLQKKFGTNSRKLNLLTTYKVFHGLLKLELKAHLLPNSRTKGQLAATIILAHPNMVITQDQGLLANLTSSNLAFIAMKDHLFHLKTFLCGAVEIFAIPSMDQVDINWIQMVLMFCR